jgi:WD40 repeat protein
VALSADGERLASGSGDCTVKLWDARTGRLLHTLAGHETHVTSVALSADGERLASGSEDHAVKLWDARTYELIDSFEGYMNSVTSVCLSSKGKMIISGSSDGTIKFWSENRRLLATILNGAPGEWLAYTPEGYFTGSDTMIQHTLRQFKRGETKFAEEILKLENPNSQKVAEAIQGIVPSAAPPLQQPSSVIGPASRPIGQIGQGGSKPPECR